MLVALGILWKTSTGNLERRFRTVRETATPQRARLLDVSVESCMLITDHTPASKSLHTLHKSILEGGHSGQEELLQSDPGFT